MYVLHGKTRSWIVALAGVAGAALPVRAQQRDTVVRARVETRYEAEVDRLARDLLARQQTMTRLVSTLEGVRVTLRKSSPSETERVQLDDRVRQIRVQLMAMESERDRLQRRLSELCRPDEKPDGWVGIYITGEPSIDRGGSGPVVRYFDYPTVESVEPGSPAEKAGLLSGDLLLAISGQDMRKRELVFTSLLKPGARLPMRVKRGAETKVLTVTVERRPEDFEMQCPWVDERISAALTPMAPIRVFILDDSTTPTPLPARPRQPRPMVRVSPPTPAVAPVVVPTPPPPPSSSLAWTVFSSTPSFAGAQFATLNADLGASFGVDRGLLVLRVGRGSASEESGLRAGDVIVSANGRAVTSPSGLFETLGHLESREMSLQIIRKRKPVSMALKW